MDEDAARCLSLIETHPDPGTRRRSAELLLRLADQLDPPRAGDLLARLRACLTQEKDIQVSTLVQRLVNRLAASGRLGFDPGRRFDRPLDKPAAEIVADLRRVYNAFKGEETGFDERYEIIGRIAEGGMAVVLKGVRRADGVEVAIKLLKRRFLQKDAVRERFQRESDILLGLRHLHIVSVFERGEHEGRPFIIMEYVSGGSLKDWIGQKTRTFGQVMDVIRQTCQGLAAAHDRGIIHRDVKPANILLQTDNGAAKAKLADFGLARSGDISGLTRVDTTMGTFGYMSPEQEHTPLEVTPASDVYSLGVTLYVVLSGGRFPVGDYEPLSALNQEVPAALDRVVERCLSRRPEDRWPTASDLERALAEAAGL